MSSPPASDAEEAEETSDEDLTCAMDDDLAELTVVDTADTSDTVLASGCVRKRSLSPESEKEDSPPPPRAAGTMFFPRQKRQGFPVLKSKHNTVIFTIHRVGGDVDLATHTQPVQCWNDRGLITGKKFCCPFHIDVRVATREERTCIVRGTGVFCSVQCALCWAGERQCDLIAAGIFAQIYGIAAMNRVRRAPRPESVLKECCMHADGMDVAEYRALFCTPPEPVRPWPAARQCWAEVLGVRMVTSDQAIVLHIPEERIESGTNKQVTEAGQQFIQSLLNSTDQQNTVDVRMSRIQMARGKAPAPRSRLPVTSPPPKRRPRDLLKHH